MRMHLLSSLFLSLIMFIIVKSQLISKVEFIGRFNITTSKWNNFPIVCFTSTSSLYKLSFGFDNLQFDRQNFGSTYSTSSVIIDCYSGGIIVGESGGLFINHNYNGTREANLIIEVSTNPKSSVICNYDLAFSIMLMEISNINVTTCVV